MDYKNQHVITEAYLKAWCDPSTPHGQEPYVWRVSNDGKEIKNKAPKNVFVEKNFYTQYKNGKRFLELEHRFHKIEDAFLKCRTNIENHNPISDNDFNGLIEFVISTFIRTKYQKRSQEEIWEDLLKIYKQLDFQTHLPELYNQVEEFKKQPIKFHLDNFSNLSQPILMRMNLSILMTRSKNGFITSDNPVIWLDPNLFSKKYPFSFFGLMSPLLEIFLPISPHYLAKLSWTAPNSYTSIDATPEIIDFVNSFQVVFSDEYIVMNNNKPNPLWFEQG